MSYRQTELTVESAIAIQTEQLNKWKEVLRLKVYKELKAWATAKNHLKKSGHDIIRGSDLDNFVANYLNSYTPPN